MDVYLGTVLIWAPNFAPLGFAYCNGGLISVQQNPALFSLLGTTYGGNGTQTFALPDLRSRIPVGGGMGAGPGLTTYPRGLMAGFETVTLIQTQLPMHNHSATGEIVAYQTPATDQNAVAGQVLAAGTTQNGPSTLVTRMYANPAGAAVTLSDQSVAVQVGTNGGSQPHENRQPFLGIGFVICVEGLYPPQS